MSLRAVAPGLVRRDLGSSGIDTSDLPTRTQQFLNFPTAEDNVPGPPSITTRVAPLLTMCSTTPVGMQSGGTTYSGEFVIPATGDPDRASGKTLPDARYTVSAAGKAFLLISMET